MNSETQSALVFPPVWTGLYYKFVLFSRLTRPKLLRAYIGTLCFSFSEKKNVITNFGKPCIVKRSSEIKWRRVRFYGYEYVDAIEYKICVPNQFPFSAHPSILRTAARRFLNFIFLNLGSVVGVDNWLVLFSIFGF